MISELVRTFEYITAFVEQSIADLSDDEMVEQPVGVPNHAAWTVGHIIYSCQGIAAELGSELWLPEAWESDFGYGSKPLPEKGRYPTKPELLRLFADSTIRLRQVLLSTDESMLRRSLPDDALPTMAHLLLQVVLGHTGYHAGQLAVWRRAIGKESAGVFI